MVSEGVYLKYALDYFKSYGGHQPFHYMEEPVFLIIST
jgi:hypothetical protein